MWECILHDTKCIMVIDDLIFYDYITTLSKNGNSRMVEGFRLSRYTCILFWWTLRYIWYKNQPARYNLYFEAGVLLSRGIGLLARPENSCQPDVLNDLSTSTALMAMCKTKHAYERIRKGTGFKINVSDILETQARVGNRNDWKWTS